MALTHPTAGNYWNTGRREPGMVYLKPPAIPSDQAEYHTGAIWHLCVACRESWLCREHHAHRHPGCPGKPYVITVAREGLVPPLRGLRVRGP